jgi:hypothetical protein
MKIVFFSSLLLMSSVAWAGTPLDKQAIQLSVAAGNIPQQRLDINQKITQQEYAELTAEDRVVLNQELDSLESNALAGNDAVAAQNKVNGILTRAFADSKLVCTYEQALGSNMKKRQCMTVAAKKKSYDNTQKTIETQKTPSYPFATN